jgi:hypothetical protein
MGAYPAKINNMEAVSRIQVETGFNISIFYYVSILNLPPKNFR